MKIHNIGVKKNNNNICVNVSCIFFCVYTYSYIRGEVVHSYVCVCVYWWSKMDRKWVCGRMSAQLGGSESARTLSFKIRSLAL